MHNANFYEELKNKMTFHDMLYNEYVDFKLGTPLDEENFNILQGISLVTSTTKAKCP